MKGQEKNTHFLRINTSVIDVDSDQWSQPPFSSGGGPQMLKQPKNQQKAFLRAKKTQILGHGENHSTCLRKKELCDPEGYLKICFKSLASSSAWFSSKGSSVLLLSLLHLSKVPVNTGDTLEGLYFSETFTTIDCQWLLDCSLTPGSTPAAVTRSSHLHCDAAFVCDGNKRVVRGAWGQYKHNLRRINEEILEFHGHSFMIYSDFDLSSTSMLTLGVLALFSRHRGKKKSVERSIKFFSHSFRSQKGAEREKSVAFKCYYLANDGSHRMTVLKLIRHCKQPQKRRRGFSVP